MNLSEKQCKPCEGGAEAMNDDEAEKHLEELPEGWELDESSDMISKKFKFDDFIESMEFVNEVADVAEDQNHHPNIHIIYDEVLIELTTHAISGLSENDFIVAAKIEEI